jgi:pSer/pThr/pTyr-binding forkhead associated (FHA) protein
MAPTAASAQPSPPLDTGEPTLRGFLVSFQSNPRGEFWPLFSGRLTLGRAGSGENVDLPLADPTISSRHAVLHVDFATGAAMLEDTGSTNGTYVNDEHLGFNGRRELRDGDRLRFGAYNVLIKLTGRV